MRPGVQVSRRMAVLGGAAAGLAPAVEGAAQTRRLDRVTIKGSQFLDSVGRAVTLRGLVVLTSFSDGRVLSMDRPAYERMRGWGLNAQVIRLESCRLGATLECKLDPAYLDKLRLWVDLAEAAGVYTLFKMTTYDSPSWGVEAAFSEQRWNQFWDLSTRQQDAHLSGWQHVWRTFNGRTAVVGYDILNEPHVGLEATDFHAKHLFPYYRRASRALRQVDPDVGMVFQPAPNMVATQALLRLDDPHPIYAPHFYPTKMPDFDPLASLLKARGEQFGYATNFMEFGWPDSEFRGILPAWTPAAERKMAEILDSFGSGFIRPWYVHSPTWSVLKADGSEHDKMRFLSRPFPQRLAGRAERWSFDFDSRRFAVSIAPPATPVRAASELFVAARRHYPNGFKLLIDGTAAPLDAQGVSYDAASEILRIPPRTASVRVEIVPAG